MMMIMIADNYKVFAVCWALFNVLFILLLILCLNNSMR